MSLVVMLSLLLQPAPFVAKPELPRSVRINAREAAKIARQANSRLEAKKRAESSVKVYREVQMLFESIQTRADEGWNGIKQRWNLGEFTQEEKTKIRNALIVEDYVVEFESDFYNDYIIVKWGIAPTEVSEAKPIEAKPKTEPTLASPEPQFEPVPQRKE